MVKVKATAKANGKAKATGKAQASGAAQSSDKAKALPNQAEGEDCLAPRKPMGQLGAQAVKDHLQKLKREDNSEPLARHESLKGRKAKLDFALNLRLDRSASFPSAMDTHKASAREEQGQEEGWLTMEQIALKEGLTHYLTMRVRRTSWSRFWKGCPRGNTRTLGGQPRATSNMSTLVSP
jgi:hypothetical protein